MEPSSGLTNDWWNINFLFPVGSFSDSSSWDPNLGANEYYFHFYNQVPYGTGNLNSFLQTTQLTHSIDYTAALMKEFARQVAPLAPDIQVQENDANGNTVGQNGSTGVTTIYVTATAHGSPADPGIGYLALDTLDAAGQTVVSPGANVISVTQDSHGFNNDLPAIATNTFQVSPGSPPNYYQVHAIDGLGNHYYSTFSVTSAGNGSGGGGSGGGGGGGGGGLAGGNGNLGSGGSYGGFPGPGGQDGGFGGGPYYRRPGDPNSMTGPSGPVAPGQLMTYTVQFENVGDAPALGVFVTDVLDASLDETTLSVQSMNNVVYSSSDVPVSQSSTSFPWTFDPNTRTVTVLAGNAATRGGGSFVLQARLRNPTTPGTIIRNQATIYFPNALQQATPTNTIVSDVPLPTQLGYVGFSSGVYLSTANLTAALSSGASALSQQPVTYNFAGAVQTAATTSSGTATASVFLSSAAGTYALNLAYPGDGFYHLPSSTTVNFAILPRTTVLQPPYAVVLPTATAHIVLTMTDDLLRPLQNQATEPKTVYIDLISGGTATPLASSLLSGTTVSFTFALPQPLQSSWSIRARFNGDSRYAASVSSGTLQLIEATPPTITLQSPSGGNTYSGGSSINVGYSIASPVDLTPSATAYLMSSGGDVLQVTNGMSVPVSSLSQGSWTFVVSAADQSGHFVSASSQLFQVLPNPSAPQTSLVVGSPNFGSSPIYISTQTSLSFNAAAVQQGAVITQTQYSIDGGAYVASTAPFTLGGSGLHQISFFSTDSFGNIESPESQSVDIDLNPPQTGLLVAGRVPISTTPVVMVSSAAVSFSTSDADSGVFQTYYAIDGATIPVVATSTFTLSVGTHTLVYYSVDNVGNIEAPNLSSVTVVGRDVLPPRTALYASTESLTASMLYAPPGSAFGLSAVDDAVSTGDAAGVGVAQSYIAVDTSAFSVYSGTFNIVAEGTHSVSYFSLDLVGNRESTQTANVGIDATPPVSTLLAAGSSTTTLSGVLVVSTGTALAISAVDPVSNGVASGVGNIYFVVDADPLQAPCLNVPLDPTAPNGTCANEAYAGPFTLAIGTHTIYYFAQDAVGNQETEHAQSIYVEADDVLPPRTTLVSSGPAFGAPALFATDATTFSLTAVDDRFVVGDSSGVGVAQTYIAVDTAAYSVYPGPFTIPAGGSHVVSYYSADLVGNVESVNTKTVDIDLTPPVTSLQVNGASTTTAQGSVVISSLTALAFSFVDPVSSGVASGVAATYYVVDQNPFSPGCLGVPLDPTAPNGTCANEAYDGPFTLSVGTHSVYYFSEDYVGNQETVNIASVTVGGDILPPRTYLSAAAPSYSSGTITYATDAAVLTLTAVDDLQTVGDGIGSGVVRTEIAVDSGALGAYAGPFELSAEGAHSVQYYSVDAAGNVEATRDSPVLVDLTPPQTKLKVLGSSATAGGVISISSTTPLSFAAADPLSNGVASGVGVTYYVVDQAPFSAACENVAQSATAPNGTCANEAYDGPFTLSGGTHTVYFFSEDNVGNQETVNVATIAVTGDVLPPRTSLVLGAPSYSSSTVYATDATPLSLASVDDAVVVGDGAGVGVARTFLAVDTAAFSDYWGAFELPAEGVHSLSFYSIDAVGNAEVARSTSVSVDLTPPQTSFQVLASSSTNAQGVVAFSSLSRVALPAVDPVSNGVASGVAATYYVIDADPFSASCQAVALDTSAPNGTCANEAYAGPFTLAIGTHTIYYFSEDNVGNQEIENVIGVAVSSPTDVLPPRTYLAVGSPRFGANPTYVSSATELSLYAYDDAVVVGDDAGVGVAATYVSVDSAPYSLYASSFTIQAPGQHLVSFYSVDKDSHVEVARSSSVYVDVQPPALALTPAAGGVVIVSTPTLFAVYSDTASGVSTASVRLTLDSVAVSSGVIIGLSSAAYSPAYALSVGTHSFAASVADNVGNVALAFSTFLVDTIPPSTTLLIDGLARGTTTLLLVSTDTLGFVAVDTGPGVAETIYSIDGGTPAVYASTFTLSVGTDTLSYYSVDKAGLSESTRAVALTVKPYDTAPPGLTLIPSSGSFVNVATPTVAAVYIDTVSGVDLATIRLSLDGVNVTTAAAITASSASYVPAAALSQGTHTVTASVASNAGVAAYAASTFTVDTIPPVTTLLIDGLASGTTDLLLVSTDTLEFVAVDTGTGVAATYYAVDTSSFSVYESSFSLVGGTHSVLFFSRDNAGNSEAPKSVFLLVSSSGTPEGLLSVILFPGGVGVEQAVGLVPQVLGIAQGPGVAPWTLGVAAGTSTSVGFKTIASGAGDVNGALGAWNTAGATGPQTLQLAVSDALGGMAVSTAPAYAGAPVYAGSLGSGFADWNTPVLHEPSGLAVRSDGNLWIDMASGELILMNSSGTVLAQEGGGESRAHDRDGSSLRLNDPHGLALDSTGYLYIADTGNNRVIKLSVDGGSVLTQYGSSDIKRPYSVAVDSNGTVYVGDAGDGRVAVFSNAGGFESRFGVASSSAELRGLALTYRGLWVSDRGRNELDLWSRAGVLLQTITGAQAPAGELTRVRTLSADALGALYVIESDRDRVQKFDPLGDGLLAFGSPAQDSREERWWHRYLTAPSAAAVGPDGTLWVADRGADRLVRFALPGAPGTSQAPAQPPPGSTPPVTRNIDTDDGGSAWRSDGTGVQVPPGNVGLTVGVGDAAAGADIASRQSQRQTQSLSPAASEVDFEPSGTMFASPVTLSLAYDPLQVAQASLDETALQVYWWNANAKQWVALPSTVDTVAKVVRAQTSHFSLYQAMAPAALPLSSGGGAYDAFGLRAHYAFPNPSRRGAAVDFRIQPGLADSVDLRVYGLTGRKVLSTTISNVQFIDDGNGLGSQDTYDYLWNVGGVGSGVYTYVFVAHKSGQHDITASGRVGIIK